MMRETSSIAIITFSQQNKRMQYTEIEYVKCIFVTVQFCAIICAIDRCPFILPTQKRMINQSNACYLIIVFSYCLKRICFCFCMLLQEMMAWSLKDQSKMEYSKTTEIYERSTCKTSNVDVNCNQISILVL